jgi:hypothetical protein
VVKLNFGGIAESAIRILGAAEGARHWGRYWAGVKLGSGGEFVAELEVDFMQRKMPDHQRRSEGNATEL